MHTLRPAMLATLVAVGAEADPRLCLNEVLYDPPGPDAGFEFVELFHPGTVPLPLDGVELWFLNGATPDATPRVVWRAPAGAVIAPGGFRVIGGAEVPERDDSVELGLQNGPDALWLVHGGHRLDAVAWGAGAAPLGEGDAAPQLSGAALGRVPDGHDTDDNASDFRALPRPTPAAANLPAVSIEPILVEVDPPWRADGGSVNARSRWLAEGWSPQQDGTVHWLGRPLALAAAAGETLNVVEPIHLDRGRSALIAEGTTRRLELAVHVGASDLLLTEVQPRPASGEPEWVELLCTAAGPVELAHWAIADASGTPRRIGGETALMPGERALLSADTAAFLGFHSGVRAPVLRPEGGWPTLNDSDGDAGTADAVVLLDPEGVVVDRMLYRAKDITVRGRSLQRTAAIAAGQVVWVGSLGGTTPGGPHPAESQGGSPGSLRLSPDPFTPDGDGIDDVLQVVAPRADGTARATVRDLAGVLVRELEGVSGDDRSYWQWDGRDARGQEVAPGAYVVVVRSLTDGGEVTMWRALVGLDRAR